MVEESPEPAWVIKKVAEQAGVSEQEAASFIDVAHHVVDKLVTDGVSVLAPPLMFAFPDDPVFERLRFLVKDDGWSVGPCGFDSPFEDLVASLHLPSELLERYPFVGDLGILLRLADDLGLPDDEAEKLMPLLDAWLDTYTRPDGRWREYRVRPLGKEAAFEAWLEADLSVLTHFGYNVRLADAATDGIAGRQPQINRRSIPDLVCRVTESREGLNAGDWLVIENKVTAVGQAALHQLSRYVDLLPTRVDAPPERVHGLLLADGATVNLRRGLEEGGLGYISLTALGYRDFLRGRRGRTRERDPDQTAIPYPTGLMIWPTRQPADREGQDAADSGAGTPGVAEGDKFAVPPNGGADGGILPEYREFTGEVTPLAHASRKQLTESILSIVAVEGPVTGERLQTVYIRAAGGQRMSKSVTKVLNSAISAAARQGALVVDNPLQHASIKGRTYRLLDQPRARLRQLGPRTLDQVPPRELATLITDAAAKHGWDSSETLFREVLSRLGLRRLTANVEARLGSALAIARGELANGPRSGL